MQPNEPVIMQCLTLIDVVHDAPIPRKTKQKIYACIGDISEEIMKIDQGANNAKNNHKTH